MSRWHDLLDWVGGYPFEVAKPEEIFELYHDQGFELERLRIAAAGWDATNSCSGGSRPRSTLSGD